MRVVSCVSAHAHRVMGSTEGGRTRVLQVKTSGTRVDLLQLTRQCSQLQMWSVRCLLDPDPGMVGTILYYIMRHPSINDVFFLPIEKDLR